jgi:hypothetical protein
MHPKRMASRMIGATILLLSSFALAQAAFVAGTLTNGLSNADVDTYRVRCKQKSAICADVSTDAPFPVVVHVSTTCVAPAAQAGQAKLEYGVDGDISEPACVSGCQEAIVAFQCDFHGNCDGFNSIIGCDGSDLAKGFPKRVD